MIQIGTLAVFLALIASAYGAGASIYGGLTRRRDFVASGEHAAWGCFGMVVIAVVVMLHALITHDFSLKYVASYTSTTLPLRFRMAALWGGMEGSLLFWVLILTTMTSSRSGKTGRATVSSCRSSRRRRWSRPRSSFPCSCS
jgi:cytochrome c-type biogenesis protein CcmF